MSTKRRRASKGDVLPEGTFEQRTIRKLIALERQRLDNERLTLECEAAEARRLEVFDTNRASLFTIVADSLREVISVLLKTLTSKPPVITPAPSSHANGAATNGFHGAAAPAGKPD